MSFILPAKSDLNQEGQLTIHRVRTRERHEVLVPRKLVSVPRHSKMSTLRIELRRHQLDHDDLMPDEIIPRLEVLRNCDAPFVVRNPELVPSLGRSNINPGAVHWVYLPSVLQPGLVYLEPDLLPLGLELVAWSVARRHVDKHRARGVHPGVLWPHASQRWCGVLELRVEVLGRLIEAGRARRGDVVGADVAAGLDRGVLRGVARGQGVPAVAGEVGMVHGLDRVWPPAALDALRLLVLEKPWVRAGRTLR